MAEPSSLLNQWDNFYVIVGSSAGALIGLQFVVMALIAESEAAGSMLVIRAFATPTIVHFCFVLLISAIVNAPWHGLMAAGISLASSGVIGVVYVCFVIRHARHQTDYKPELGDWLWYAASPLTGHATLLAAGIAFFWRPAESLFVVAAAALALLFVGIHNAWDTVTYVAIEHPGRKSH